VVYKKLFVLSGSARTHFSAGALMTHYAVDADKIQNNMTHLHTVSTRTAAAN
jgi:hypothetical protein